MDTYAGTLVAADVIGVLVVDDHRTFAQLLSLALDSQPDVRCLGTADDPDRALAMVVDTEPDVVVVDIEMPALDGLKLTRRILALRPETVVVVVTAHRDPAYMVRATQAGASAFVPKNGSLDELLDAVRHAHRGGMMLAPSAFATGSAAAVVEPTVRLTTREQDVLACLGRGMAPKAIARVLGISLHTCRGYVKSILAKLEVSSQLEAVVKAQRLGLLCE